MSIPDVSEKWSGKVRCSVKTGSLAICRALAGYIPTGERTYVFAFILAKVEDRTFGTWASRRRDELFTALVTAVCGK